MSHFIFRCHFGQAAQNSEKNIKFKMSGKNKTPTEIMNSTYKLKAPKFPERLNRCDTDNILFCMTQHLPVKVCTENHMLAMFFFRFPLPLYAICGSKTLFRNIESINIMHAQ